MCIRDRVYIGVPPALAAVGLAWMALRRLTRLRAFLRDAAQRLRALCGMDLSLIHI